jgi:hypothetical protein
MKFKTGQIVHTKISKILQDSYYVNRTVDNSYFYSKSKYFFIRYNGIDPSIGYIATSLNEDERSIPVLIEHIFSDSDLKCRKK